MASLKFPLVSLFASSAIAIACVPTILTPVTYSGNGCPSPIDTGKSTADILSQGHILHLGTPQYQINEFEEYELAQDSEKSLYCSVSLDLESSQSCSSKEYSFRWHVLTRGYSEVRGQGVAAGQDLVVTVNNLQKPMVSGDLSSVSDFTIADQNGTVWAWNRRSQFKVDTRLTLRRPKGSKGSEKVMIDSIEIRFD